MNSGLQIEIGNSSVLFRHLDASKSRVLADEPLYVPLRRVNIEGSELVEAIQMFFVLHANQDIVRFSIDGSIFNVDDNPSFTQLEIGKFIGEIGRRKVVIGKTEQTDAWQFYARPTRTTRASLHLGNRSTPSLLYAISDFSEIKYLPREPFAISQRSENIHYPLTTEDSLIKPLALYTHLVKNVIESAHIAKDLDIPNSRIVLASGI